MKEITEGKLLDLDSTILDIKRKISNDPDPFLVEVLKKLETIRSNQQYNLENKARRIDVRGGFKGMGIS
jgi:hypothetical protein